MPYYPKLDVLRGVAVLLVIGYHLRLLEFGYLGVDIFFVLSGFLITSLLLAEDRAGLSGFVLFLQRRCRRLLPASALVTLPTVVASFWLLPPNGVQQSLGLQAISSSLFVSNIYFWKSATDYFYRGDASGLPLLHLWSLSVEWQFYLIWGALVTACMAKWRRNARVVVCWLVLVGGALSTLLHYWAHEARPLPDFYLLPPRVWEFFIGAALSLALPHAPTNARFLGSAFLLGTAAVGFMFCGIVQTSPYGLQCATGLWTGLAIAYGVARPALSPSSLLTPIRLTGLVSYSWYLWHWPILSLYRNWALYQTTMSGELAAVSAALVVAVLSYRLIERPLRTQYHAFWRGSQRRTFALSTGLLMACATGGAMLGLYAKYLAPYNPKNAVLFSDAVYRPSFTRWEEGRSCTFGARDSKREIYLWGDSHAMHYRPLLERIVRAVPALVLQRARPGCPPLEGFQLNDSWRECALFNTQIKSEIISSAVAGNQLIVLLAARWPVYFGQPPLNALYLRADYLTSSGQLRRARAQVVQSLSNTVAALEAAKAKVVLFATVPELTYLAPLCAWTFPDNLSRCGQARAVHEEYNAPVMDLFRSLIGKQVHLFDPTSFLCKGGTCAAGDAAGLYYVDSDHLSEHGASALGAAQFEVLRTALFDWPAH